MGGGVGPGAVRGGLRGGFVVRGGGGAGGGGEGLGVGAGGDHGWKDWGGSDGVMVVGFGGGG